MNPTLDAALRIIMPLIAAFIGAIIAFRYQRNTELNRDKRLVFQTLMIYRNVGVDELDWIKAINAIDVVFHDSKKVRELYQTFLSQTRSPMFEKGLHVETFYQLLYEMAQCIGYSTLKLSDIRDYYSPKALDLHYPNMNKGDGQTGDLTAPAS